MSSGAVMVDVQEILKLFAENSASGEDLRRDVTPQSLYFRLRDARSEARAEERLVDNDPSAEAGISRHWKTVRDLALEALGTKSKDLEIAAWLTESLVRTEGLAGLAAGASVLAGLVRQFWDDGLFPLPDEDGMEGRVAPIAGLNGQGSDGTLMQPLRKLALFHRNNGNPLSFWQFDQAEEVASLGDAARKAQRLASGVPALADLEAEAQAAGRAELTALGADTVRALAAWQALEAALADKAGREAPPTRRIHDLLEKLRRIIERYVPIEPVEARTAEPAPMIEAPEPAAASAEPALPATPSREELLDEISRISALFRTNEPNSPLSHTLDEAVRRARLSWPELLKEVMPDLPARTAVLSSLGIKQPAD